MLVAPFVGAWIETIIVFKCRYGFIVAPFVGAWIETYITVSGYILLYVAPFVGAWIETYSFTAAKLSRRRCSFRRSVD